MYICICKAISEKEWKEEIERCGPDLRNLQKSCGAGTDCGACRLRLLETLPESPAESSSNSRSLKKR